MTIAEYVRQFYGGDPKIRSVTYRAAVDQATASDIVGRLTWCAAALADPSICHTCRQQVSEHLRHTLVVAPAWPERHALEEVMHALV